MIGRFHIVLAPRPLLEDHDIDEYGRMVTRAIMNNTDLSVHNLCAALFSLETQHSEN